MVNSKFAEIFSNDYWGDCVIRITKDRSGEITVETDHGSASDHVDAHKHKYEIESYMNEYGVKEIEEKNYHDVVIDFWQKDHDKNGSSSAMRRLWG